MSGIESLLDTNVVIGLLKQNEAAAELVKGLEFDQIAISQITRMELLGYPGLPSQEEQKIQAFLKNCHVLLIDESVEQRAIQIRCTGSCKLPDAIIAATALVHRLRLLTLDERLARLVEESLE